MCKGYLRVVLEPLSLEEDFYVDHPEHYDTLYGYEDLREIAKVDPEISKSKTSQALQDLRPLLLSLLQMDKEERAQLRILHAGIRHILYVYHCIYTRYMIYMS